MRVFVVADRPATPAFEPTDAAFHGGARRGSCQVGWRFVRGGRAEMMASRQPSAEGVGIPGDDSGRAMAYPSICPRPSLESRPRAVSCFHCRIKFSRRTRRCLRCGMPRQGPLRRIGGLPPTHRPVQSHGLTRQAAPFQFRPVETSALQNRKRPRHRFHDHLPSLVARYAHPRGDGSEYGISPDRFRERNLIVLRDTPAIRVRYTGAGTVFGAARVRAALGIGREVL